MSSDSGTRQGQAVLWSWIIMLLLLGFCTMQRLASPVQKSDQPPLPACSAEGSVFATIPYELDRDAQGASPAMVPSEFDIPCISNAVLEANGIWESQPSLAIVDVWSRVYHQCVAAVIDAHQMRQHEQEESAAEVSCITDDDEGREPPTGTLLALAMTLPPWSPVSAGGLFAGPVAPPNLSETDMSAVLLEFVRVYECSMLELLQESLPRESESTALYNERITRQLDTIREELATARESLEQTLLLLGSLDRLRPLVRPLRCFLQASLDIRNGFGLFAEAASCMPRAWDPFSEIRDTAYPAEEEE